MGMGNRTLSLRRRRRPQDLAGNGDGTFRSPVALPGSFAAADLATADLTGDGNLDIVATNDGSPTGLIGVWLGNGNGTFKTLKFHTYAAGAVPYHIEIADMNGDGKPDVIVASGSASAATNAVSVLLGNGDGTFAAPYQSPPERHTSTESASATLTADGHPDVVASLGNSTVELVPGKRQWNA